MKNRIKIGLFICVLMALTSSGISHVTANDLSIVGVAEANGNFTVLLAAAEATGLRPMLDNNGPFTLFAPTDAAFAQLPQETLDTLMANPNTALRQLLLYHMIQGEESLEDIATTDLTRTALGKYMRFSPQNGAMVVNNVGTITAGDVDASNGLIHVVDVVLFPPDGWGPDAVPELPSSTPPPAPDMPDQPQPDDPTLPEPPGVPGTDMSGTLLSDMQKARLIIEAIGFVLDRSDNGKAIPCDEFNGYYDGLKALQTYEAEQLPANLQGIYTSYRNAVQTALDTNESIFWLCENGGDGHASPLNFGIARQGVHDTLIALIPLIDITGAVVGEPVPPPPPATTPVPDSTPSPTEVPTQTPMPSDPSPISSVTYDGPPKTIRWFVGLGTGTSEDQLDVQVQVVERFNAMQDNISLELEIVDNGVAGDTLATYIAAGDPPDIVGPVGIAASNRFADDWLDMQPIIDDMGYDLNQFMPGLVDFHRVDGELQGLPIGVFPTMIFYNRDLFDEAGLDYPPQQFGETYADGDTWDFDKVRELAMYLTFDADGNDAYSDDFDIDNVEQWGFAHQFVNNTRELAHSWGAADLFDANGNAVIPDSYREALSWTYEGIWRDGFIPNESQNYSDLLQPSAFASDNVGMALTHIWYTCCAVDMGAEWDLAVVPSANGAYTSKLHTDTFRMLDIGGDEDQKKAAFSALSYLMGEASADLSEIYIGEYGGMPARPFDTGDYFSELDETYPFDVNWQVAVDSLAYPDIPSHEGNMPNYASSNPITADFWRLLQNDGSLDLTQAIEEFRLDLDAAFDGGY